MTLCLARNNFLIIFEALFWLWVLGPGEAQRGPILVPTPWLTLPAGARLVLGNAECQASAFSLGETTRQTHLQATELETAPWTPQAA